MKTFNSLIHRLVVILFVILSSYACSTFKKEVPKVSTGDKVGVPVAECSIKLACELRDQNTDGFLEPGETASIVVIVKNEGTAEIKDLVVKIGASAPIHLAIPAHQDIKSLLPRQITFREFLMHPISEIKNGSTNVIIDLTQREGKCLERITREIRFKAKPEKVPLLTLLCKIEGPDRDAIIHAGESRDMIVTVRNSGNKEARDVVVTTSVEGKGVTMLPKLHIGDVASGTQRTVRFPIQVDRDVPEGIITIKVSLDVSSGKSFEPLFQEIKVSSSPLLLNTSIEIKDTDGDGLLSPDEQAVLCVTVENEGLRKERNVVLRLFTSEASTVSLPPNPWLGDILPAQVKKADVPIRLVDKIGAEPIFIGVQACTEPNFCMDPVRIEVRRTGRAPEEAMWEACKSKKGLEACLAYLSKFPQGKHVSDVEKFCEELRWEIAEKTFSHQSYEEFLRRYPNGRYTQKAKDRLNELKAIETAEKKNTYEGYKTFCHNYPSSRWNHVARERISVRYWRNKSERNPTDSDVLCQLANALVGEEGHLRDGEAKKHLFDALRSDRRFGNAYFSLSKILLDEADYGEARKLLIQARKNQVDTPWVYYFLGKTFQDENKQKAIEYFTEALKRNPHYLECLYNRGLLYKMMLRSDEARHDFETIVRLAPDCLYAKGAREYLNEKR
ncbi:MAG: hypothetical protein ABID54_08775 [Pseudomonadota bacterium]